MKLSGVIMPDNISVQYAGGEIQRFSPDEAPFDFGLLEEIKQKLFSGEIEYLMLENTRKDISLTVWREGQTAFFGILDSFSETGYYYDGPSDSSELLPVCGGLYQERHLCRDISVLAEAIDHFAAALSPSPELGWTVE